MSDSITRKPEENTAEAIAERLKRAGVKLRRPENVFEIQGLPRWVRTALVYRIVHGMTWKQAASKCGKAAGTLALWGRKSPAGKKWIEKLKATADNPVELARATLESESYQITLDRLLGLRMLVEAGEHVEADKIMRDIQDRIGPFKQARQDRVQEIRPVINLTVYGEIPMGEAHHELVVGKELSALPPGQKP